MDSKQIKRFFLYLAGLVILAIGLILNTKCTLGVSPILSVAFSVSEIWKLNFGDVTLVWYVTFILVEIVLHVINNQGTERKKKLVMDVLQLPLSIGFTRIMNLFSAIFPVFETDYQGQFLGSLAGRILILLIAIILTGIGASLTLRMKLIPNPGDGIVAAIGEAVRRDNGTVKNFVDVCCVIITLLICFLTVRKLVGIGIGTIIAALGVGRVMAVCNKVYDKAGLKV